MLSQRGPSYTKKHTNANICRNKLSAETLDVITAIIVLLTYPSVTLYKNRFIQYARDIG